MSVRTKCKKLISVGVITTIFSVALLALQDYKSSLFLSSKTLISVSSSLQIGDGYKGHSDNLEAGDNLALQRISNDQAALPQHHDELVQYKSMCILRNITLNSDECSKLSKIEAQERKEFPIHYVSGIPGSGNDWILWLASINRYTWPLHKMHSDCELYNRILSRKYKMLVDGQKTTCLFIKTHEPWYWDPKHSLIADKVTLLLRHPYDSAFAEFKRLKLEHRTRGASLKRSANKLKVSYFFDLANNRSQPEWLNYVDKHVDKFLRHATFWLTEYERPLHILLYSSVKQNTAYEVESMQRFFGYEFNGANFRRHCCVMDNTFNPVLKREASPVDQYRNMTLATETNIREKISAALKQVHEMMDVKFPDHAYRIGRG